MIMKKIQVTEPFLPPKEEYEKYLDGIWERNWLTNMGPLSLQLEEKLKDYLGLNYVQFVANGTLGLQLAVKALGLEGEIITTPFSYVATTSSIVWEGCEPVFADIDPNSLNIDPNKIENAITTRTTAILATHVFGNPCNIDAINKIAKKHDLKVIYDAAHCFGTMYRGKSVFCFGDISIASFHATKTFHTIEGGAVMSQDQALNEKIYHMKNFGHSGPGNFVELGINGKNSEFHAAMGLANLPYIADILEKRKSDSALYIEHLPKENIDYPVINAKAKYNFSYFPVIWPSAEVCQMITQALGDQEIYPKKYFYPSLSTLSYVEQMKCPISDDIANRILCLPLYYNLQGTEIKQITKIIKQTLKKAAQ